MTNRRILSSSLSAELVQYLVRRGYTQADVARLLHVSEGFVSLVKSRERSLTLDHLELLSDGLSLPLGELLLAATAHHKTAKNKESFERTAKIVRQADAAIDAILRGGTKPAVRKRATARK